MKNVYKIFCKAAEDDNGGIMEGESNVYYVTADTFEDAMVAFGNKHGVGMSELKIEKVGPIYEEA